MNSIRFGLLATLFASLFLACPPPPPTCDGGKCPKDGGGEGDCFEDTDCPDPRFFFCNTTTSKCEPSCHVKADCEVAQRTTQYALSYCDTGLKCQCDEGKCVGSLCGSDGDCGTDVCRDGQCVAAPAASTVDKCVIIPDFAVVKGGAKQRFNVEAFDSTGKPVVLKTGVAWSVAGTAGTIVATTSNPNAADFTAGSAASAAADGPTATIGTKSCAAKVEVLDGTVAGTELAVVVTDELTGRGISGATIIVNDNSTGSTVGPTNMSTGTNGYVKLTGLPTTGEINVTAFAANFNYLTVANYDLASTPSRFISLVLRRHQTDKYGGSKGTFNGVPMTSNVHAALSGMSIAGSITDLSLSQLLGQTVPTRVKIGNAIDQMDVPLPAGVYLGFSDQQIKTAVSAQGLAGTCGSAKGGETAIAAGTCGTRSVWGLAGDVPLGDLPIDAFAGGVNAIKFDVVLARIIPIFRKFNSTIVRDVEFSLKDTPRDTAGAPQFKDAGTEDFTSQNLEFSPPGAVPLAFNFVNKLPDLPKFRNNFVDGVVLLGGANVPGRGVIPLGLGVAVNTMPADNQTDKPMDLPMAGLVQLRMAPTHHGTEGSEYGILALGVSFKAFTDASAGVATSGIFGHPTDNKLAFDPSGGSPLVLPGPFPVMPEGAKYNFTSTASGGLSGRTFRIPNFDDTSANPTTAVRVAFSDGVEHRWVVLASPARVKATGFTLPTPPAGSADRTFDNGMTTGQRSKMLVQTIRLSDTPSSASPPLMPYKQLVEANNTNADRMTDFTTGFSFIDYARPALEWKTPAANGATVTKGSTIVVIVTNFKVGTTSSDDGYVKVAFANGTTCPEVQGQAADTGGKGEVSLTVPATCTGTGVTMTARLVDINGADLAPAITSALTGVTVN